MMKRKILMLVVLLTGVMVGVITPETTLTWTKPNDGCDTPLTCTYNIYRGDTSGTETLLKSGVTGLQYMDTTVVRGKKYFYQVSATNLYGEGNLTSERAITIPTVPTVPGNFKVISN